MKQENLIQDKSFKFSIRIIKLFKYLKNKKKVEKELIGQILRSGTSIGANIEEAIGAYSRKDFIHKLQIAYKESRETKYWLRLLEATELLEVEIANSMLIDCEEILKILAAILKSTKFE